MFDINKALTDPELLTHDPESNLYELEPWSREIAQDQAHLEGLGELSKMQWRVLYRLRGHFRRNGRAESAHQLMRAIEPVFAKEGGRRFLYRLFPQGPLSQGCRLAGIPPPPQAGDAPCSWFG